MSLLQNLMNLNNPLQQGLKKYIYELIGPERYFQHEKTIDGFSKNAGSISDYEALGKFMAEVYEAGYVRAIDEHRAELNRLGLKATIKTIEKAPDAQPIFNQKNPADSR